LPTFIPGHYSPEASSDTDYAYLWRNIDIAMLHGSFEH